MAAEPVKSQPLHNFSLAHLKWGHRSHHSFRRRDSPPSAAELNANTVQRRPSPPSGESGPKVPSPGSLPEFPFSVCSTQKRHGEEGETKAWKLRPRKARNGEMQETNCVVDKKLRGIAEGHRAMERKEKKKKKRKFWISLSREEIEEDVYSLTGSRPARRPKKRPKAVQKLFSLDCIWLDSLLTRIEFTSLWYMLLSLSLYIYIYNIFPLGWGDSAPLCLCCLD
nr:RNA polymerase-associated protein [Ipomoea batatas]